MDDLLQLVRISAIALLSGAVAGGFVWISADLRSKAAELAAARQSRRKKKADAAALLEQAKNTPPAPKGRK